MLRRLNRLAKDSDVQPVFEDYLEQLSESVDEVDFRAAMAEAAFRFEWVDAATSGTVGSMTPLEVRVSSRFVAASHERFAQWAPSISTALSKLPFRSAQRRKPTRSTKISLGVGLCRNNSIASSMKASSGM